MINEPKNGAYYGGTVAAPVVAEIIRRSLLYLGVEPTKFQMAMQ
jgi:cell division protein FtsI (penicillin-binding protein 3)